MKKWLTLAALAIAAISLFLVEGSKHSLVYEPDDTESLLFGGFETIAYVSSQSGAGAAESATLNVDITLSSMTNGMLICTSRQNRTTQPTTGATYGGNSMTEVATVEAGTGNGQWIRMWYLVNPPSGTNTLSMPAHGLPTRSTVASYACAWYSGVEQAAPDASNSGSRLTAGDTTVSVTTLVDNSWLVGASYSHDVSGTGYTNRSKFNNNSIGDSNGAKSPTGSYSMTVTESFGNGLGLIVAALAPAQSATPPPPQVVFFE